MDAISPRDQRDPNVPSVPADDRRKVVSSAEANRETLVPDRPVRARLNGLPCLLTGTSDSSLNGRMAVPPMAGERPPLPTKGKRATLELLPGEDTASQAQVDDEAGLEPLEITVTATHQRSGRFSARFLTMTDDQWRLLDALGLAPSVA